jgi:predicted TIM-barrel fold metal-dependent hydrolase
MTQRNTVLFIVLLAVSFNDGQAGELSGKPAFDSFRKIDIHAHFFADIPGLADRLQTLRMDVINVCWSGKVPKEMQQMEAIAEEQFSKYGRVFQFASTFDLTNRNMLDYEQKVIDWLDKSYAAGAVLTKIWKEIGMEFKTPTGDWLMPDDPLFDPIYTHMANQGKPLLAHLGEPLAAWRPLDPKSPHYHYYRNNPEWHFFNKPGVAQWEDIIAARDRILEKHPGLTFIGAHMGSMAHDVNEVAQRLDRYNNFFVETAARIKDLMGQPKQKVRNFLIRYQDRVLYGTDFEWFPPEGIELSAEKLEAWLQRIDRLHRLNYEYFAGSGMMDYNGQVVECLDLPVEVLKKFYYDNARRIILDLAQ